MKRTLISLLALLLLALFALPAAAETDDDLGVMALVPAPHEPASAGSQPVALYCGPTQSAYRHGELTLNPDAPYLYFGQADCWAMVALGTPEAPGPIGWVEAGMLDAPLAPELLFEDAVLVMIEEDTFLTDEPDASEPPALMPIARGTWVTLLARYGVWGYVQLEMQGAFIRAFLPLASFV